MRTVEVLYKGEKAGILIQKDDGSFVFKYEKAWLTNTAKPSISLTLPKSDQAYQSKYLFPFFYNMLPEGSNKQLVCKYNRLDEDDHFSLLMAIAHDDTIGAISIKSSSDANA